MKIASWNVNSIKVRLPLLLDWLAARAPDIVCLQELKCVAEAFPAEAIAEAGYTAAVLGQKTYNGVAILSRLPMDVTERGLPGLSGEGADEARYIEVLAEAGGGLGVVRVGSIYLPNGNPAPGPKYDKKRAFFAALTAHARTLLAREEVLVLAGDYNVIPHPRDVHDPAAWAEDALFLPESRAAFAGLVNLGFTDAIRACHAGGGLYTFWDYQAGAWPKNRGIRIDHLLLSPRAADRLTGAGIDRERRALEKASDHVPVWCTLGP